MDSQIQGITNKPANLINKFISIIIPNYNGVGMIEPCLEAVFAYTKEIEFETIIVDNGSTDGSISVLNDFAQKYPNLSIIPLEVNMGFSFACNLAYHRSKGEFIVLLSNDTKVTQGWLQHLLAKMLEDPTLTGCVQSKLILMDYPDRLDIIGYGLDRIGFLRSRGYMERDIGQYDEDHDICITQIVCCLLRRKAIEDIGGLFDSLFFIIHEDTDLSLRLHLRGYRIRYAPKSLVYHKRSWTLSRFSDEEITYLSRRNILMTIWRNYNDVHVMIYGSINIAICCGIALWYIVKGKLSLATSIASSVIWILMHMRIIMEKRVNIQKNVRKVSDEELFQSFDKFSILRLIRNRHYGPLLTIHLMKNIGT